MGINNANVLCLGGKLTPEAEALKIADAFLEQEFVLPPGGYMAPFWSSGVESFLKGTPDEIQRIEDEACRAAFEAKPPHGNSSLIVGCDGFGEDLKNAVVQHLKGKGVDVQDLGTEDFFSIAAQVARGVQQDPSSVTGMLFCGTGMGVSIVANKFKGVYAAVVENEDCARNSRAINNANVLCLGGKLTPEAEALKIADAFLEQEFVSPPGGYMAPFWSSDVESFLKGTPDEIQRIEEEARQQL